LIDEIFKEGDKHAALARAFYNVDKKDLKKRQKRLSINTIKLTRKTIKPAVLF